jgi:hypothetical protein
MWYSQNYLNHFLTIIIWVMVLYDVSEKHLKYFKWFHLNNYINKLRYGFFFLVNDFVKKVHSMNKILTKWLKLKLVFSKVNNTDWKWPIQKVLYTLIEYSGVVFKPVNYHLILCITLFTTINFRKLSIKVSSKTLTIHF